MKFFKLIFILTTVVLLRGTTVAQAIQWQKIIGDRAVNEECKTSVKLHSNLYAHGGSYLDRSGSVGQYRPFLLFTNSNGDSLRSVKVPTIKGNLSGLAPADSGGVVALGSLVNQSNLTTTFLICFDSLGAIRWQRDYNLPGDGASTFRIEEVPDGYLLMANKTNNSQAFSNSNSVIKTDRQGNQLWQKVYELNAYATAVTPMLDGSYMLLGYTTIGSTGSPTSPYSLNLRLINITPDGDTIRTKVIGSPTDKEFGNSIKQTSDGGFIIVGHYVQNVSNTKRQGYVVKLDSSLNEEWDLKIMPDRRDADLGCELYEVQETINGDFFAAGYFLDQSKTSCYLANISSQGAVTWSQLYNNTGAGTIDFFHDMIYEEDGSVLLTGRKFDNMPWVYNFFLTKLSGLPLPYQPNYCQQPPVADFTFSSGSPTDSIKFTDQSVNYQLYGNISKWEWDFGDGTKRTVYTQAEASKMMHKYQQPTTQLAGTAVTLVVTNNLFCTDTLTLYPWGAPTAVAKQLHQLPAQLYPQPMQQHAVLEVSGLQQTSGLKLEAVDMLGRVYPLQFSTETGAEVTRLQVQRGSLAAGMYVYRLQQQGQVIATGKLVVE